MGMETKLDIPLLAFSISYDPLNIKQRLQSVLVQRLVSTDEAPREHVRFVPWKRSWVLPTLLLEKL
jgi:hypothetical protein